MQVVLPNDPASTLQAATKQYADTKAASSHTHAATDVNSGTLDIARVPTGTSGTTACIGNDSRLSDSRAPTGTAGGALNGTYPNPNVDVVPWPPVTLTDAATIAVDASLGNLFFVTLGGNRTMGAPSNPTHGQRIVFEIKQDGTGGRTLAWTLTTGGFKFGTDVAQPVLSTAASATDFVTVVYNSTANVWRVVGVARGY